MHLRKGIGAVILAGAVAVSAAPTAYCNDTGTEPIERPGWTLVFQEEFLLFKQEYWEKQLSYRLLGESM